MNDNDSFDSEITNKSDYREERNVIMDTIPVRITNPAPIVILFGPPSCGKTMAWVRLTRWLEREWYHVEPDLFFRSNGDEYYRHVREQFERLIYGDKVAELASYLDFMLLKVHDSGGNCICQILDIPGLQCISGNNKTLPRFIEEITYSNNQKIWMFFVEGEKSYYNRYDSEIYDDRIRNEIFQEHIRFIYSHMLKNDKSIFLYAKADLHHDFYPDGKPCTKRFFEDFANNYSRIIDVFKNDIPLIKWFRPYNFDFIVFSAGTFDNGHYIPSENFFPEDMWKAILRNIK